MKWTTELPTKEGYYWFWREGEVQMVVVYLWQGELNCATFGDNNGWHLKIFNQGYWMGPLEQPSGPL